MRIALVVHDFHREGGHSRYCSELAERFAKTDEVHIFANRFSPASSSRFTSREDSSAGIRYHRVPAARGSALGTVLSFYPAATRAVSRAGRFDIVHAQGFACGQSDLITAHICCAAWHAQREASGHRFGFKERLFDGVVTKLESRLYSRAVTRPVIAISKRVREDLSRYYGRSENVEVIPHGVDTGEFSLVQRGQWRAELRARLNWPSDELVALWVGDLRKGSEAALRAVAQVPNLRFAAVSRNDASLFVRLAEREGIAGRTHFLPPTSEIAKFYAAADIFLFPTTYDAFGMVVMEAMAMGLPAVVSRDAGAAELITHGSDGLLLSNPFDPTESAGWLRRLCENPAWRQELGARAAATAERHSWDAVAAETMKLYRRIAASRA